MFRPTSLLLFAAILVGCPATPNDAEGDDPQECRDGADNDGNGDFDCADAGCQGSPDCDEEVGDDDDAVEPLLPDPDRILIDVAYLASEELAGRMPGHPGNDLATEYMADRFASLGLDPAGDADWFRAFSYTRWQETDAPDLAVGGTAWNPDDFEPFRGSGSAEVEAEVVFVGYGFTMPPYDPAEFPDCPLPAAGFDEYADVDVTGKIALVLRHGPSGDTATQDDCPSSGDPADDSPVGSTEVLWRFTYKMNNALAHGATAMLMVPGYDMGSDESFGGTLRDSFVPTFPSVYLNRDRLEGALPDLRSWADAIDASSTPGSRATGVTASVSVHTEETETLSRDVVGALPGSDPELASEVILVGAHIDHLGPGDGDAFNGADDNASGSAVMLELARLMLERPEPPARTVVFASFNAEELGLVGSCDYAADPSVAYPVADLAAMVSVDMVGAGDASGLVIHGGSSGPGRGIYSLMRSEAASAGLDLDITPEEPSGRSDHACFADNGVPAVLATTAGPHPDYHQQSDEIDGIDPDDLGAAASLLWAWLQAAADGADE